jgi:pSer/pThr/pTyr-binding forkhead associated (FHA) protein
MPASPTPKLHFQVFKGDTLVAETDLKEPSITIGRGPSALLRIDDPSLGEFHSVINVEDDGTVQLLDLGTEAGTRHKGQPISNVVLASGDAFEVGAVRVIVSFEEAEQTTPTMDVRPEEEVLPPSDGMDGTSEDSWHVHDDVHVLDLLIAAGSESAGQDKKQQKCLEVSHIWGDTLMDTKQFRRGTPVTIGPSFGWKWSLFGVPIGWVPESLEGPLKLSPPIWSDVNEVWSSDFYVASADLPKQDDHILFQTQGNGWIAKLDPKWNVFADFGAKRVTLQEMIAQGLARQNGAFIDLQMSDDMDVTVDIGGVMFFARLAHPNSAMVAHPETDVAFLSIVSVCGFIGVMFALLMWFSPPGLEAGSNEDPDRFVELLLEKPPEPPKEEEKDDKDKNEDAGEGAKAKKEEGKVGKKEAKLDQAKGEKTPQSALDREIAENAGVLGALNDPDNMLNSGLDSSLSAGIGGLIGTTGTQFGAGGLGARGGGLGGGGTADGLGGLGSRGTGLGGSGSGTGGGDFGKGGSLGSKGTGTVSANTGEPIILGALDRSLIDQVIKRKMSQIRYCYQRELQKNPTLAGKVTIKFTIAKDGTVSQAGVKSTTLSNGAAEKCIADRFYQMQFPEPKGGGIVVVSYPFIFAPG